MHPCLCVDEILRVVFRCIEDRSTWCALARTCRAFTEPATDLIWETLTAVEPILQHLPSARTERLGFGDRRRCLVLSRPLSDDDWSIIRRLSSRVHRLHTFFIAMINVVPQWVDFLASPPDPSFLFPNLRALSIEVPSPLFGTSVMDVRTGAYRALIRFFHLLLGPHLSALRFSIPDEFYTDLDISSIPALCPNIRMLDIAGFMSVCDVQIPEETVHLFSRAVSKLSRMEIVRSSVASWQLLSSLAQAKELRQLRVKLPYRLDPEPRHLSGDVFPQLRALDIWADSLASCIDLFRWTSPNQVTEMSIRCLASYDNRDPLQALVNISSLISSQCRSLDFLWISWTSCGLIRNRNRNGTPSSARWRPMLEPYQACHHLRIIALQVSFSLTIADNDLEDMVKAWPHLAVFHLFPDGKADPPVHLTLRGITALLDHCPELKDFTLMFNATRVPECIAQPGCRKLVRNPSVKYMGVHTSPVSASSDIAAYLSTIMPSLKIIRLTRGAYEAAWSWICTRHPQKPTIHVDLSPMKLYYLLTAGTESSNEDIFGREWNWIHSSDAGRR